MVYFIFIFCISINNIYKLSTTAVRIRLITDTDIIHLHRQKNLESGSLEFCPCVMEGCDETNELIRLNYKGNIAQEREREKKVFFVHICAHNKCPIYFILP